MGKQRKLLTVVVPADKDKKPYKTYIDDSLEAFQQMVGGYIETVPVARDVIAVVNEEGLLLGLPVNRRMPQLVGDLFLMSRAIDRYGRFNGLTQQQADAWLRMLGVKEET